MAEVGSVGFEQTSEERVIERAGVSREQFESLYTDKTDCFIKTYEAMVPEFMGRVASAFAEGASWRERLRRSAYASLDYFEEDPARAVDQSLNVLVELIDAGRYETEDPDSIPRSAAEAAVGSIWSILAAKIRQRELTDERLVPQLMYVAVLPYLGEEAAREELAMPAPPPIAG